MYGITIVAPISEGNPASQQVYSTSQPHTAAITSKSFKSSTALFLLRSQKSLASLANVKPCNYGITGTTLNPTGKFAAKGRRNEKREIH